VCLNIIYLCREVVVFFNNNMAFEVTFFKKKILSSIIMEI
jgi:hypothetical protein